MKAKKIISLVASGLMMASTIVPASATANVDIKDVPQPKYSAGIFQVYDSDFEVSRGGDKLLSDDSTTILLIPGGGPAEDDLDSKLQQNKELWHAVDSITVRFIITKKTSDLTDNGIGLTTDDIINKIKDNAAKEEAGEPTEDIEFDWMQFYIQGGKRSGWLWTDAIYANQKYMDEIKPETDGGPIAYGEEIEYTFDIKAIMEDPDNAKAFENDGILKMGMKVANAEWDEEFLLNDDPDAEPKSDKYHIEFTGLSVKGDEEIINKYAQKAKDLVEAEGGKFEPTEEFVKPNVPLADESDDTSSDVDTSTDDSSSNDSNSDSASDTSSKDSDKNGVPWGIIGGIAAGVIVIAVIVFIVVKKKK